MNKVLKAIGIICIVINLSGLVLIGTMTKKTNAETSVDEFENILDKLKLTKEQYRKGEQ